MRSGSWFQKLEDVLRLQVRVWCVQSHMEARPAANPEKQTLGDDECSP